MDWYYAKNGAQSGPVSTEELRAKMAAGEIRGSEMVWREGMSEWKPASTVAELSQQAIHGGAAVPSSPPSVFQAAPAAYPYPVAKRTSGLAIASLVCGVIGLLGFFLCFLPCIVSIGAVICGHLALRDIKRSPESFEGRGLAIGGLVCGYLTILVVVIGIVFVGAGAMLSKPTIHGEFGPTIEQPQGEPFSESVPAPSVEAYD